MGDIDEDAMNVYVYFLSVCMWYIQYIRTYHRYICACIRMYNYTHTYVCIHVCVVCTCIFVQKH